MNKVLKNKLMTGILVVSVVCLGIVFAGDVIVKEGAVDVSGSAILGDATTDYHAINTNPDADSMLTAEFLNTEEDSTHYFFKGKFTDSGDTTESQEKFSYGYHLDMVVSGDSENDDEETKACGVNIELFDYSVLDNSTYHRTYGVFGKACFSGTNTDAGSIEIYGGNFCGVGQLGDTGIARHYGINTLASGTADTNYGIYARAWGATTNYAGYFSGDVHITGDLYSATESAPWDKAEKYDKTDVDILTALEKWDKENVPQEFYREVEVERIDETTGEVYYITETQWNIWEIIKLNQGAILELKQENQALKDEIAKLK